MSADVEAAITETIERARLFLFDAKGKLWPEAYSITSFTLQGVVRLATVSEVMNPRLGHYIFDWHGKKWLYDSGLGELLLSDAKSNIFCDQVLCNAGAALLNATGGISETRLRAYVCGRLSGTIPAIKVAKRGFT